MHKLADPLTGLKSLQKCFKRNERLDFQPGRIHANLSMHFDEPEGHPRLTYAFINQGVVKATCVFCHNGKYEDATCFQVGYAVALPYRRQGMGKLVFSNSLDELASGFKGRGPTVIEAMVGTDNIASRRIAARILTEQPETGLDEITGEQLLAFRRRFVF